MNPNVGRPQADAAAQTREPQPLPRPRPDARFMFAHPAHLLAFGFGSGLAPWAPGTFGTLFGWLSYRQLHPWLGSGAIAALLVAGFFIGWWICAVTARHLQRGDPSAVVWDEILAFWLVLWLVMPTGWLGQLVAFGLFRFFDAVKPQPVRWADQLFKPVAGRPLGWREGLGIMFDDLVAAGCTLLVIAVWKAVLG